MFATGSEVRRLLCLATGFSKDVISCYFHAAFYESGGGEACGASEQQQQQQVRLSDKDAARVLMKHSCF